MQKLAPDKRNHTCGFQIPNGGFYWVVEMTFDNHTQLSNLSQRVNYSVDLVEGPEGFYDADGYEVIPESLEIEKITKRVVNYAKKTRKWKGQERAVRAKHVELERPEILNEARMSGIKNADIFSTEIIKAELKRRSKGVQSTLVGRLS